MNPSLKDFGLTISLKKTNVMGQDTPSPPAITINNYKLDSDHQFTYLGSTITDNLSLDTEFKKRVSKAATTLTCPTTHVWSNPKLTVKTKMAVYNACILGTLHALYDSGNMDNICQTGKEAQHLPPRKSVPHLGHILARQSDQRDKDLSRAGLPIVYTLLTQCQVHWLDHVCRMEDSHIPKDILYGALEMGQRSISCLQLRFKDVRKRDMRTLDINTESWEDLAADGGSWKKNSTNN